MSCETFRHAVGAEPNTTQREVLEHAASCPACAQFRTEMLALNGLIHRALHVEVDANPRAFARPALNWRIAASIFLAVVVFAAGWLAYPRPSFAEQVVAHVLHEAPVFVHSDARAAQDEVRDVLNRAGVFLAGEGLPVSFASLCPVRGHKVPHLVVQTDTGPVTVLVMTEERAIGEPQRFEEQGFVGTVMPAPRGVIAVLAREGAVDEAAATTLRALRYD